MSGPNLDAFLRKLQASGRLAEADRRAVLELPFTKRTVPAASYLVREGEPPAVCTILLSGYAFRHKIVGNGGRQIVSLHISGEALDLQSLYLNCADHSAQALTECDVAIVPMTAMRKLVDTHPAIARAVLLDMLVEASVLREWIANIGRRDARTRLAHMLCEFATRLSAQEITTTSYELPMTQEQLGDALGLTSVHVNRTIKSLEAAGLIERTGRTLRVPDFRKLRAVGDFNALYLHLDETSSARADGI